MGKKELQRLGGGFLVAITLLCSCDEEINKDNSVAQNINRVIEVKPKELLSISIITPNGLEIQSKEEYMEDCDIKLESHDSICILKDKCKIKGHGNSTWAAPKKPYVFKFRHPMSICEMAENKTYVLLANYYDSTMIRNDLGMFMGQYMSRLDYTPKVRYSYLTLNGKYQGIYQLGEN
jgi:hypothetical protein